MQLQLDLQEGGERLEIGNPGLLRINFLQFLMLLLLLVSFTLKTYC